MEKNVLWDKDIEKTFDNLSENQLDNFLELLFFISKNNIPNYMCLATKQNADMWEWLYSRDEVGLNDIKKELIFYIEKTKDIGQEEFEQKTEKIGKNETLKILVIRFNDEEIFYISTIDKYYAGMRYYLAMEKKDDFAKDLQECFPNIYFVSGIGTTINTLNRKFDEIRGEIVEHLTALNDYHKQFISLSVEQKSNREIAEAFKADTGIDCSPQGGREGVQGLKVTYFNQRTKCDETITCELHTKFKKFNINRREQDRIYFFSGKDGIQDGKVIVKHIGTHL